MTTLRLDRGSPREINFASMCTLYCVQWERRARVVPEEPNRSRFNKPARLTLLGAALEI